MTPFLQHDADAVAIDQTWTGFAGKTWQVHKFGGTSVANADCYRAAARIVEDQLGINHDGQLGINNEDDDDANRNDEEQDILQQRLAVVVSAMGGKPKTTDLLLQSVQAAARRDQDEVDRLLEFVLKKHATCLEDLFGDEGDDNTHESNNKDYEELLEIVRRDLSDINDILKTVALMKWQAERISELVSGYGELWSARILSRVLHNRSIVRHRQRQNQRKLDDIVSSNDGSNSSDGYSDIAFHEFVFIDARRVIIIDEEAIQDGAVEWNTSQVKLKEVYETEVANNNKNKNNKNTRLHFVITGYVASNTEGVATTLQRDGSDYSAAIMGRLLQSTNITIWTDVDGGKC